MLRKDNWLLNALAAYAEKRRLRRSFEAPFITGTGRDAYRYYENGRFVEIYVEMMLGPTAKRIHRQDLKWSDSGETLTAEKNAYVLTRLCEYFDRRRIKWEFFGSD